MSIAAAHGVEPKRPAGASEGPHDLASGPYGCSVVTDPAELAALEAEWNALNAATPDAFVSDGFGWARLCWSRVAAERGRELSCAVVRRGAQTIAIWPLVVSRRGPWRLLRSLCAEASDYAPFLAHPCADLNRVWRTIRTELARRQDLDAFHLLNVRHEGALGQFLITFAGAARTDTLPAPFLARRDFRDWQSYVAQLPPGHRAKLRQNTRRLAHLGKVEVVEITDPSERQALGAWIISTKRAWLRRRRLRCDWMFSDNYPRFVADSLSEAARIGGRRIFALKAGATVVAAELVNVDRVRVESFVGAFDARFARCAPGNLLREEMIRWAFERNLDYDCRMGDEAYKQHCSSQTAHVSTFVLALTPKGRLFVVCELARRFVGRRTPDPVRRRIAEALQSRAARHRPEAA